MSNDDARKALDCIASAAQTIRQAISVSLPVAPTQLMTMQIPGLAINPKDYTWDQNSLAFAPLAVRVNEARLVDNMVPVSKMTMGRTGKSVARSYLAALDLLVPVEASVSSAIALNQGKPLEKRLDIIRERYERSMKFLKSRDDLYPRKSKLTTYVDKQESWNKAVEQYAAAQERQMSISKEEAVNPEQQRQLYLEWIQAHARDYKAMIQARYMDWVVHGYKFEVEFNFAVVDISSGMKRVESSKEAFRNLILIDSDGASEYSGVKLNPSNWAKHVQDAWDNFNIRHKGPSPVQLRSEIKRLKKLVLSHEAMYRSVDKGTFLPITDGADTSEADKRLREAYLDAYKAMDSVNSKSMTASPNGQPINLPNGNPVAGTAGENSAPAGSYGSLKKYDAVNGTGTEDLANDQTDIKVDTAVVDESTADDKDSTSVTTDEKFKALRAAQEQWTQNSLAANQKATRSNAESFKAETKTYLRVRIKELYAEIKDLESQLSLVRGKPGRALPPVVIDADGKTIEQDELKTEKENPLTQLSPWTRISVKVSQSQKNDEKVTEESANSFAAKARWGFWEVSGSASHTSASAKAMTHMSNLDVEIAFDAMLVEIERPWMHTELFSDHELDCAEGFSLSPGPEELHQYVARNLPVDPEYTQFCSYPTAFVVASNVELEFSGNTSSLESALESSSTEANVEVGYGPFALSASHRSSKSKAKTRAEATATGMRISLQAPQIISWVSELLPKLPKAPKSSQMFGMTLLEKGPPA
ncbi:MAG: hypothetical protein Q9182_003552 [Xanthomendoza sp. 2 TL-2023]